MEEDMDLLLDKRVNECIGFSTLELEDCYYEV